MREATLLLSYWIQSYRHCHQNRQNHRNRHRRHHWRVELEFRPYYSLLLLILDFLSFLAFQLFRWVPRDFRIFLQFQWHFRNHWFLLRLDLFPGKLGLVLFSVNSQYFWSYRKNEFFKKKRKMRNPVRNARDPMLAPIVHRRSRIDYRNVKLSIESVCVIRR